MTKIQLTKARTVQNDLRQRLMVTHATFFPELVENELNNLSPTALLEFYILAIGDKRNQQKKIIFIIRVTDTSQQLLFHIGVKRQCFLRLP